MPDGTLHVFAQETGKSEYYINDVLSGWYGTTAPYSNFATNNGTGNYQGTSYMWPANDDLTFYAYYYKDSQSSLRIIPQQSI